jgi:hypothetical protein
VTRGDLAHTVSQVLTVIASNNPALAAQLKNTRRRFPDVPAGHLRARAAAMAVEAGVMQPLENDTFQLARPVTGAEAVAVVDRLASLAGSR